VSSSIFAPARTHNQCTARTPRTTKYFTKRAASSIDNPVLPRTERRLAKLSSKSNNRWWLKARFLNARGTLSDEASSFSVQKQILATLADKSLLFALLFVSITLQAQCVPARLNKSQLMAHRCQPLTVVGKDPILLG